MGFHLTYGSSGSALLSTMDDADIARIIDAAPSLVWTHQQPTQLWERIAHCREHGYCLDLGGYTPRVHTISGSIGNATRPAIALTLLGMPGDLDPPDRAPIVDAFTDTLRRSNEAIGQHEHPEEMPDEDR